MPPMLPKKRIKSLVVRQLLQADLYQHLLLWGVMTTEESGQHTPSFTIVQQCSPSKVVRFAQRMRSALPLVWMEMICSELRLFIVVLLSRNVMFSHRWK